MAHFMSDNVSYREISGRPKAGPQLMEESQVDIKLFIAGTIERPDRCSGNATTRINLIGKQDESRLSVTLAHLAEDFAPRVLSLRQDYRYELFEFLVLRIC